MYVNEMILHEILMKKCLNVVKIYKFCGRFKQNLLQQKKFSFDTADIKNLLIIVKNLI